MLANPNVPDTTKTQIAKRAWGHARRSIAHHILEHATLDQWLLLADVFTPGLPTPGRVYPAERPALGQSAGTQRSRQPRP